MRGGREEERRNRRAGEYVLLNTPTVSRLAGSPLRRVMVTGYVECKGIVFCKEMMTFVYLQRSGLARRT